MIEKVKIDKGIEIPKPSDTFTKYPWHDMKIGDSFIAQPDSPRTLSLAGGASRRYAPKRFVSRKEGENRRVWRIA